MSERKLPPLCYIGPYVVGVVSACECPTVVPPGEGLVMYAQHPHESHDIVPPRMEDEIPEGVDFDDYRRWCRMFAASPDMLALLTEPLWLVWSNEHRAWWGPNRSQYYWNIAAAGRYTLDEALEICKARGVERGDGINPPELVQPSPEWLAARKAAIAAASQP